MVSSAHRALDGFSPRPAVGSTGPSPRPPPPRRARGGAISEGSDVLVVAPTGSGKTLAAFLAALDQLASAPPPADPKKRCRVLYVSPLKALAVDVERNLRSPLTGIRQKSVRLGLPEPEVKVGIRSGDTPGRRAPCPVHPPAGHPDHHPGSLFLMLTSATRDALTGIETVILDEVHAVAGTKRGAHLALTLERLDELLPSRPSHRPVGDGPSRWTRSPGSSHRAARWRSSSRTRTGVRPVRRRPGRGPGRAGWFPGRGRQRRRGASVDLAARGGGGSPTSSSRTAPRSSSPTPGVWPSACATGSTRSRTNGRPVSPWTSTTPPPNSWAAREPPRAPRGDRPRPPRLGLRSSAPRRGGTSRRAACPRWWPPRVWSWVST